MAEFSDGESVSIKTSVAFNVIPEGMVGTVAIVTSALATTVLYLRRRITAF